MQRWKKLGLLYAPDEPCPGLVSHATMPLVRATGEGAWDVYFAGRDNANRSRVWRVRMSAESGDGFAVHDLDTTPVLDLGAPGCYDDSGVFPTCIVEHGPELHLYFNGWTAGSRVPFYSFNGRAASADNGKTFQKLSAVPNALERNDIDPVSTFSPFVLHDGAAGVWRMWYVSCLRWSEEPVGLKHYYHIRYAESADGLTWKREGRVAIDFAGPGEYAIARPVVLREEKRFLMYYSYRASKRGDTYRIGYAESPDGLNWTRMDDKVGLDVSPGEWDGEWDGEMLCYGWPFGHAGRRYMLYNGNGYGRTGFGLAVLE